MIKVSVCLCLSLFLLTACASSKSPLNVEVGDICTPTTSEQIFHEGLYQSERQARSGDAYYSWTFIRFFEDCHFNMVTSFEENAASAASIFLRAGAEDSTLTTGRYSLNGSIVNMKSESSEYIGQISGDTLELEFYSHKTKKGGEHVFTYHPVETIRQDVFNQPGLQQEAPQP